MRSISVLGYTLTRVALIDDFRLLLLKGGDCLRPRCPLSMDCGRMSNEAEYMNLDVENKTSKVETCIVDLLIKVAENRQFGMPNS